MGNENEGLTASGDAPSLIGCADAVKCATCRALAEAVEPFAELAKAADIDSERAARSWGNAIVSLDDCRRARKALSMVTGTGGAG